MQEKFMIRWKALFNQQTLRSNLIKWFLVIALLPLGWTTIIAYEMCKRILFDQTMKNLQTFIFNQENLLKFYFEEKKNDSRAFITDRTALKAVPTLDKILSRYGKDSPEYEKARQEFYPILAYRTKALDYRDLLLLTTEGKLVFSVLPSPQLGKNLLNSDRHQRLSRIIAKSRDSLEMDMISIVFDNDKDPIQIFISMPMIDFQNNLKGIALVELDTLSIYHLLSTPNELGTLTNLLLVTKEDHTLFAITPKNIFTENESKEMIDPTSSFGKFILEVLMQQHLEAFDIDYHNRKTLMAGKRFGNISNWALVTEINEADLLAPIRQLKYLFWLLLTATVFAVTLAASYVARKIAAPILQLTDKTRILAAGDLSQRIDVTSQDEIGRLGESFNEMASQLDHIISHLDFLVAKRTEEYEIQNVKLEQTISELHKTRDRLITQEKLASLGSLTAGIAHEIKNPLNFVNNFSELSLQILNDIEKHLNSIKAALSENEFKDLSDKFAMLKLNIGKINDHGQRADSIVRNMLQHSRGLPGERMKIDIHKLLDEYVALSYHGMRAKDASFNVTIEKNYDPTVPLIEVVPQEISRVFLNLLNNAYYSVHEKKKHQRPDSYQPTVRITTENHQDEVIIKIWDNGVGIAPDVIPKLFTPFFSTKPPGEGTGLGLSLSYNIIVQGHGGTLTANSQVGEFAEFIIHLAYKK
jgi:two-component system, NtrC family, sensor kinase